MLRSLGLRSFLFAWAVTLTLVSCGKETTPVTSDDAAVDAASSEAVLSAQRPGDGGDGAYAAIAAAAVADPARSEADRERDERRKPEAMLTFMKVKPGLSVFEIEAGDGYMTELFSRAVGSEGSVVMQNPEQFREFAGAKIDARLADNRLPNVRASYSTFDALDADDASMDLVTWVWGPHELYYHPESGPGPGDPATAYSEIFRILKPGGAFVVIDHAAADGSPETTGNDLHRIDPAIVKRMAERAGFVLEGDSDFLVNPDDPLSADIAVASIRGRTSQFALRFRKPG